MMKQVTVKELDNNFFNYLEALRQENSSTSFVPQNFDDYSYEVKDSDSTVVGYISPGPHLELFATTFGIEIQGLDFDETNYVDAGFVGIDCMLNPNDPVITSLKGAECITFELVREEGLVSYPETIYTLMRPEAYNKLSAAVKSGQHNPFEGTPIFTLSKEEANIDFDIEICEGAIEGLNAISDEGNMEEFLKALNEHANSVLKDKK